jgi:hypothetical protein
MRTSHTHPRLGIADIATGTDGGKIGGHFRAGEEADISQDRVRPTAYESGGQTFVTTGLAGRYQTQVALRAPSVVVAPTAPRGAADRV